MIYTACFIILIIVFEKIKIRVTNFFKRLIHLPEMIPDIQNDPSLSMKEFKRECSYALLGVFPPTHEVLNRFLAFKAAPTSRASCRPPGKLNRASPLARLKPFIFGKWVTFRRDEEFQGVSTPICDHLCHALYDIGLGLKVTNITTFNSSLRWYIDVYTEKKIDKWL